MKTIKQLILSGILSGLAITFGVFCHFPLFGGQVYLIGVIVFMMPFLLRLDFLIVSSTISVVLTDVITGYGNLSWISFIAYTSAVLILWFFAKLKLFIFYFIGFIFASGAIISIYFFLEREIFGFSYALHDLIATSIQMSIVTCIGIILIYPVKIISLKLLM